jgi:hypothetical protein
MYEASRYANLTTTYYGGKVYSKFNLAGGAPVKNKSVMYKADGTGRDQYI